MVRLTRAQQQDATRRKVLAAAKSEFAQRGFRGATIDGIAERADMTRGAVYSNFPGKRALYLAVLAHEAEQAPAPIGPAARADTPSAALRAFASTWLEQLPRSSQYEYSEAEQFTSPGLSVDFVPEVLMSEQIRRPFAQLLALDALLLAVSLRAISQPTSLPLESFIASAESVLTILYGTTQLSYVAPEFTDPARSIALCEQVALLGGVKTPSAAPPTDAHVTPVDESWDPPSCTDRIRGDSARLDDGMIAVLGMHRIATIEAALSIWPEHTDITLALVSDRPAELAPLARLAIADICRSLRHAFPAAALPRLQVVVDGAGTLAAACGFGQIDDDSEFAVIVEKGRITTRAEGRGAGIAAATAHTSSSAPDRA